MARPFEFQDLLTGFSVNQLSQLFGLDRRTVSERLRGVHPSGLRSQHPVYRITDAAPLLLDGYLYSDKVDEKTRMQNASREKDMWDARLKEQKFKEIDGDLWRTEKVVEVFAATFKRFRESVVIFVDAMEHEADLPPAQVAKTKMLGDQLLADARERLLAMDTGDDDVPGSEAPGEPTDLERELAELGLT